MNIVKSYLSEFIGYLFILTIAPHLIALNVNALWDKLDFGIKQDKFRSRWHPNYLGRLELIMYLTAFLSNKPEFIIAWLGIKTIPQVIYWQEIKTLYNFFLIGNALIVIFSFATARIIFWAKEGNILLSFVVVFSLIIFNFWSYIMTKESTSVNIEKQKLILGKNKESKN
ncbi:MAG TPA: hypothetical protein VMW29_01835 [Candidatus Bathyarchaeia archaeon]|nr:hypothetical protein [Candidatus Bathyarchaeia archaeon]